MRPDHTNPDREPPADWVNPDLYSPENARQLAENRAEFIANPRNVLLDEYQAVTELELKHPPGSREAQERYIKGLRGEVTELHHELMKAFCEHPYHEITQETEGPEDSWLASVLDQNRLRFVHLSPERKEHCLGELGDVMWYASRSAAEAGFSLSEAYVTFLHWAKAGKLPEYIEMGHQDEILQYAANNLTFELTQEISQSQKTACVERINIGTPIERDATIDNMAHILVSRIYSEELWADNQPDDWPDDAPYSHLPDFKVTVGKLVWFCSYAANSLLNADFCTVMRANLEKVRARSSHGTIFNNEDRTEADEATIKAHDNARMPLGVR